MASDGQKISEAWKRWRDSDEGQRCIDRAGLLMPPAGEKYLRNRIELAFIAGYDAATGEAGSHGVG